MKTYFNNVSTVQELTEQYRKLVKELHPDKGGNESEFKEMQNQYDIAREKLGNFEIDDSTTTKSQKSSGEKETANEMNEEKKSELFAKLREKLGFVYFDKDLAAKQFASDFAAGKISFSEMTKKLNEMQKEELSVNADFENKTFEEIISAAKEISGLENFIDFNNPNLKNLCVGNNVVYIYHGTQSETDAKFDEMKVSKTFHGMTFNDMVFVSVHEISASTIIRSLRSLVYYYNSVKRIEKQIGKITAKIRTIERLANELKEIGFSSEEIKEFI